MKRKLLSFCLAGILALSLTACNQSENPTDTPQDLDAEGVLAQAMSLESDIESMGATMVTEMQMKVTAAGEEQTIDMLMTAEMETISDPLQLKMTMTTEAMGESMVMEVYAQEKDGSITMYLNDGTGWSSGSASETDILSYTATSNLASILAGGVSLAEAGSEDISGRAAFRYEGSYTGDAAKELLLESGTLDSVSQLGLDAATLLDSMDDGLSGIPVKVWIDKENCQVLRYEMDMTDMMNDVMSAMFASLGEQAEGLSIECPVVKITMDCRDYNALTEIVIPEEALAA